MTIRGNQKKLNKTILKRTSLSPIEQHGGMCSSLASPKLPAHHTN